MRTYTTPGISFLTNMVSVKAYVKAQLLYDNKVRDFISKFKGLCIISNFNK